MREQRSFPMQSEECRVFPAYPLASLFLVGSQALGHGRWVTLDKGPQHSGRVETRRRARSGLRLEQSRHGGQNPAQVKCPERAALP